MAQKDLEGWFARIDWAALEAQKISLLARLWKDQGAPEWGIVHALDDLQDLAAERLGEATVFPSAHGRKD